MSDDNDRQRTVDLGDRAVAGADLRSLCCEPGGHLQIKGGTVSDMLDLADVSVPHRLSFENTTFSGMVDLSSSSCHGLEFTDCRLLGGLDASAAAFDGDVTFTRCRISGSSSKTNSSRPSAVWLTGAEITGRLGFTGTTIGTDDDTWTRAVHGDRVKTGADLSLIDGCVAHGEVKLTGAVVGASVLVYGAHIEDPYVGLYLSEARIAGNLLIMDARSAARSRIAGGLVVSGTAIGGQLLVFASDISARAQSDNPRYRFRGARSGVAFDATRAQFDGDVRIYGGSTIAGGISLATATVESQFDLDDTVVTGPDGGWGSDDYAIDLSNATLGSDLRFHGRSASIRLENAEVAGSVHFEDLTVTANQDEAIEARNVRVGGDVWLDRARLAAGDTDFRLSHVAGDWRAPAARFDSTGADDDYALTMTSMQVDGSVFVNRGFHATGLVRLNRSRIGGRLAFDGATIRQAAHAPSPLVVACRSTTVGSGIFLDWDVDGAVDLQSTRTDLLVDDPDRWGTTHIISGLGYERLQPVASAGGAGRQNDEVARRLRWLAEQERPDAGTYSQLAAHYRRQGRTVDAEQVLMARNRFLRAERQSQGGWRNVMKNLADVVWDISVGYGYRASRAAVVIVALIAATGAVLAGEFARDRMVTADEDNVVFTAAAPCEGGTVRCYNPMFYAIDTVVPLVDLQQRSTWYVSRSRPNGAALEWGLNLTVLLGWAASSALVLGLTRTLSPEA